MNVPNRITIRLTVDVELSYNEWKQKYALAHTLPDFNKLSAEEQEKVYKAEWFMLNEEIPGAFLQSDDADLEVTEDVLEDVLGMEDFRPQVKNLIKELIRAKSGGARGGKSGRGGRK